MDGSFAATRYRQASASSNPPPRQSPLMAATVGTATPAMRSKSRCPSATNSVTCSRVMVLISNRSTPALNDRALAEAKITPAGWSRSMESSASARSAKNRGEHVLTDLPGASIQIVTTLSAS